MSTACLTTTLDHCSKNNTGKKWVNWVEQRTVRIKWDHLLCFFKPHMFPFVSHLSFKLIHTPHLTCAEVGRINDQLNLWGKVMNNVYVLIIHGGQPSTYTTAPLEITGSPRQHKLSIRLQSAFVAQQAKAKQSLQNIDARKATVFTYHWLTRVLFFDFTCTSINTFAFLSLAHHIFLRLNMLENGFSCVFHSLNYVNFPDTLSFAWVCC